MMFVFTSGFVRCTNDLVQFISIANVVMVLMVGGDNMRKLLVKRCLTIEMGRCCFCWIFDQQTTDWEIESNTLKWNYSEMI